MPHIDGNGDVQPGPAPATGLYTFNMKYVIGSMPSVVHFDEDEPEGGLCLCRGMSLSW